MWIDTSPEAVFRPWVNEGPFDVAILGCGIAGLSAAFYLKKEGLKVAVFGMGGKFKRVSGFKNPKKNSAHGLIYEYLFFNFGEEKTRVYSPSTQWAIEEIPHKVEPFGIDCDF